MNSGGTAGSGLYPEFVSGVSRCGVEQTEAGSDRSTVLQITFHFISATGARTSSLAGSTNMAPLFHPDICSLQFSVMCK